MTYTPPSIDASGLHLPTYADILQELVDQAKGIFGADIYLENDSADYQFLSIVALKIYDAFQAAQLAYNNRGPSTAAGLGLDGLVKLNGLARKVASYSTCAVTVTGIAGTVIHNGVVGDTAGHKWALPEPVTIGGGGSVTVTATCTELGAIAALAGTLTSILTPTGGWVSVTNASAAVLGQPVEPDGALRSRQAISTELPSQTLLIGTAAALATLPEVTRFKVYENATSSTNGADPGVPYNTAPAHSITCVVEGAADADVAQVIYLNRGIGCYMAGDVVVNVTDDYSVVTPARFYRPVYVPTYVTLTLHGLTGYTSDIGLSARQAIVDYLNSLQLGEGLTISALYGAALSVLPDLLEPEFSIRALVAGTAIGTQGTTDLTMTYKQVASGLLANVALVIV